MIELKGIGKQYTRGEHTVTALDGISLSIHPGEIVGIIGRSGAGKSTLIRCVNLLEAPTTGSVWVNGQNLLTLSKEKLRSVRRQMSMIFQHFNLLSSRTVYENIELPLELMHVSRAEREKKILPLLELVGLENKAHQYPSQLSGGQKQRVAIARALVTDPEILLCDEMTSALDPETTHSILSLLREIHRKLNISILLITHEMEVIKAIADRVVVLDHGRVVEEGLVLDVFKHPQSTTTKSLIQSTLKLDLPESLRQQLQATPGFNTHPLIRIAFVGATAEEPVIAELVKRFDVKLNILQANLEFLRQETMGILFGTVQGEAAAIESALAYLKEKKIDFEMMGYLAV